jgi:hypothetical protein
MNNNSIFLTVLFLVAIFIGMGLLIYHTVEITGENAQFKISVKDLQARMATLEAENTTLKSENTTLASENSTVKTENATLVNDNNNLKNKLANVLSENTSLKSTNDETLAELGALRSENSNIKSENLRLTQSPCNASTNNETGLQVLQATVLPTIPESWIKFAATLPIGAIIIVSYNYYAHRRKAAALARLYARRELSQRGPTTKVIDSRFVSR